VDLRVTGKYNPYKISLWSSLNKFRLVYFFSPRLARLARLARLKKTKINFFAATAAPGAPEGKETLILTSIAILSPE
jgi:hypothetical protein